MSVPALSPAKRHFPDDIDHIHLELVRLTPEWEDGLKCFLQSLHECADDVFFSPHPTDENSIHRIAHYGGKDMYYLLISENQVLGYGMLRGWDEGYKVPSLGLAIHPSVRGKGLGRMLMNFLHTLALRSGSSQVRLRVRIANQKALGLYRSLGYVFDQNIDKSDFLVGLKTLGKWHSNEI